jgi:hypothetical protein
MRARCDHFALIHQFSGKPTEFPRFYTELLNRSRAANAANGCKSLRDITGVLQERIILLFHVSFKRIACPQAKPVGIIASTAFSAVGFGFVVVGGCSAVGNCLSPQIWTELCLPGITLLFHVSFKTRIACIQAGHRAARAGRGYYSQYRCLCSWALALWWLVVAVR